MEEDKQEELSAEQIWEEEANKSAEEKLETSPDDSDETVVAEEPQEEEPEGVEAKAEEEPADPFQGLPDAVKQKLLKIDDLEKSNQELIHHVKTAQGRVAAMQRETEIAKRVKDEVAKKDSPSQKEITTASKNPEKWDNLKEDFPEWAEAMEEFDKMQKCLDKFSRLNPKAYMTLLD